MATTGRELSQNAVAEFKSYAMRRIADGLRSYSDAYKVNATVVTDDTRCDYATAMTTVRLAGIGTCQNYAALVYAIQQSLPDCECLLMDAFYGNEMSMSKCVRVTPKSVLLEKMYIPVPVRPAASLAKTSGAKSSKCRIFCRCIAVLLSILAAVVAMLIVYVTTKNAMLEKQWLPSISY